MSRGYGILFSEFESDDVPMEIMLICLDSIRSQLAMEFPNPSFEFDIVKVTSHCSENSYPEIGVHSGAEEISDMEFKEMEIFVSNQTRNKNPISMAENIPKNESLSWEFILENGAYPKRT
ncbi:hypothetical protein [Cellvibrio sp. NN19]|uniref:hypothetical protein n=1 Tax=Cellvibrio chitinivorans TaxID=3102792 RepID=UPI002B406EA8|nr:hypothetical protein [Cellvibrio sp. NN19]